ncbi:MAG: lysophospholipid acyltransferase family protein [Polyangia bacterium]|jgi:1-acyl-sn-glycerol-3-phosphate acyltransferase|nr:lysophospholipid acyltransferase family protein [Polyangia bacterium]
MSAWKKQLEQGLDSVRSLASWTFTAADTVLFASTAIGVSAFDPGGKCSHYVGKAWCSFNLKALGFEVSVQGLENISPGQPYVAMVNHSSHLDVWAVYHALPLQIRWVMKEELRKIPFFGRACARMGHVYVVRGDSESARKSMEEAARRIAAGTTVVFFPEGTRTKDGQLQSFKTGGFRLALQAQVPILPVSIAGTGSMLPPGSWRFWPGHIRMAVGTPIPTLGRPASDYPRLMQETRESIEAGLAILGRE